MITAIHGILASSGGGIAPSNVVAPVISGVNAVGNVLTTTNGTWNGSPSPTFTYWWKRNGVPVVPFPTPSATTYNLTQLDAGYTITCEVYATNTFGTASATSNSIFVYDGDAYAFDNAETAAGTPLTTTERNAINDLVINLKNANIWTKFFALYPIIGSTATSQKFNLKNPADTNAAYRLAFIGGWTHSSNGALPNGTNAYANTFLSTSAIGLNSGHLSYYSRTNNTTVSCEVGGGNPSPDSYTLLELRNSSALGAFRYNNTVPQNQVAIADTRGFFIGTRTASNVIKLFRNSNSIIDGSATSNATSVFSQYIGAYNGSNTAFLYSNRQCAFASIGTGLTDLETQVFNQIVEGYQFALGRNINPAQSFYYNRNYGNTVNAFLYSTQVTDATTQQAVAQLVSDLTGYGIWSKMKAIYPMVGTTATQQKFNLVNSQDTNAAFRLNFVGGWTHSSLGATPNGTNAYADTFLTPSTSLSLNSTHVSYYSRVNSNATEIEVGVASSSTAATILEIRTTGVTYYRVNSNVAYVTYADSDSRGFYAANRTASNVINGWKNGTKVGTASTPSTSLPSVKLYLAALNNIGNAQNYSTKQCAFASIGDGLTDTEAANFYTAVQNFQTALGRQV